MYWFHNMAFFLINEIQCYHCFQQVIVVKKNVQQFSKHKEHYQTIEQNRLISSRQLIKHILHFIKMSELLIGTFLFQPIQIHLVLLLDILQKSLKFIPEPAHAVAYLELYLIQLFPYIIITLLLISNNAFILLFRNVGGPHP